MIGNTLGEMAKWKPWSGHRLTLRDKSNLPESPPSGRKVLNPQHIPVDISYKWTNAYKQVWDGDGHSAWSAQNLEASYCSLGDKIAVGQEPPSDFNLLLQDQSGEKKFLVRPIDLIIPEGQKPPIEGLHIWNMVLPQGYHDYECLGHAVSDSRNIKPDPSRYCCAKKNILKEGAEQSFSSSFNEKTLTPGPSSPIGSNRQELEVQFYTCKDELSMCKRNYAGQYYNLHYKWYHTFTPSLESYISAGFEIFCKFTKKRLSLRNVFE